MSFIVEMVLLLQFGGINVELGGISFRFGRIILELGGINRKFGGINLKLGGINRRYRHHPTYRLKLRRN